MAWKTSDDYRDQIDIQLSNGLWLLGLDSSIGKTALAKELRILHDSWHEPVNSISGTDAWNNVDIHYLIPDNCRVFMFDDYDMYNGKFEKEIKQLSQTSIVLMDCKMGANIDIPRGTAILIMDKSVITVIKR